VIDLVHNNFPWPQTPTEAQKAAVEKAAQAVLDARAQFMSPVGRDSVKPTSERSEARQASISGIDQGSTESHPTKQCTLADLYDPVAMPPALARAHAELDRAVDRCYRKEPFPSDRARVEFLFQLYEQLTAPLLPTTKAKPVRRPATPRRSPQ